MTPEQLRRELERIKDVYERERLHLQRLLDAQERACNGGAHSWAAPVYTPIVHEGYHDPGDPPGTMGVDRQLPMEVPRPEIPRWQRRCLLCGRSEYTERSVAATGRMPSF